MGSTFEGQKSTKCHKSTESFCQTENPDLSSPIKEVNSKTGTCSSFYYSHNETKAAVVERVIRTLKSSLHRYFRHEQTHRYLDILQKFVSDYNNGPHRSLGQFSHADVNEANADEVR